MTGFTLHDLTVGYPAQRGRSEHRVLTGLNAAAVPGDLTVLVTVTGLLRRLAQERALAVIVSTHDLELALRIADHVWLIGPDRRLRTGTPEQLTLDGAINAVFDGTDLAFDAAAGVFVPHTPAAGTVRITADGPHTPLLARALARYSWRMVDTGPADLEIAFTGDGYRADHLGEQHRFTTLDDLTAWARDRGPRREPARTPAQREA
ncbi:hypothetical protein GCM10010116_33470 [Microbispora rosea subsp. aerata]|nr:hypothetical protein [Microbispora rosea]GGO16607.1 hypothetical protein GCM10010116_33470 [Microbispora rosea subsp. aerata]GIH56041.1 hypothetical protein Mro02_29550 [Microbispora rosea subsp. aerata]GLJ86642.1 hypothetical protein GCM10017588_53800 [Microbispora rosea subsp. aerata]